MLSNKKLCMFTELEHILRPEIILGDMYTFFKAMRELNHLGSVRERKDVKIESWEHF